jgi:hypothetical protein
MTLERALANVQQVLTQRAVGSSSPTAQVPPVPAWPLRKYLPRIPWADGIRAVIGTALEMSPASRELLELESWWETATKSVGVAPLHDWRPLHGDARFANIRVDIVTGHVFEDCARFEVDLILRSCPQGLPNRADNLEQALDACVASQLKPVEDLNAPNGRVVLAWRTQIAKEFGLYVRQDVRQMYLWFVLAELIKRLRWIRAGDGTGPGATAIELLDAILKVRAAVAGAAEYTRVSESVGRFVNLLNCRRVYVPLRDRERVVNEERNEAKRRFLRAIPTGDTVTIVAETGYSYLCNRGPFNDHLRRLIGSGSQLQIVIADMAGQPGSFLSRAYGHADLATFEPSRATAIHPDLRHKFEESLRGARSLRDEYAGKVSVHLCPLPPSMTFLLARTGAFVEPYFLSDRSRRSERLFDSFEFQIDAPADLLRILNESFANYVRISREYDG